MSWFRRLRIRCRQARSSRPMDAPPVINLPDFPESDDEAQQRFDSARSQDPFPEIQPALLNTADLLDYISATGMIHPFRVNAADPSHALKPASCAIPLLGDVLFWEERYDAGREEMVPTKVTTEIRQGEPFTLKRNSIVYLTLEPV